MMLSWYVRTTLYMLILLAAFIFGLLAYKKGKKLRPIVILTGAALVTEIAGIILAFTVRNNGIVFQLFLPVNILLLDSFFYNSLADKIQKKYVLYSSIFLIVSSFFSAIFISGVFNFPGFMLVIFDLFAITWASLLFLQQIEIPSSTNIFYNPEFILSVAVLWFNILSFTFFLLRDYLYKNSIPNFSLNLLHSVSSDVYYCLIGVSMFFAMKIKDYERIHK